MGSPTPQKSEGLPARRLSKVVWSEGMYLGPQHFQAQRQCYEDLIHFCSTSLWFEPYGLTGFTLDPESLRNGVVALSHARGIFPDGLIFHMTESDALPATRQIGDALPPTQESLQVMLGVPLLRPAGANCTLSPEDAILTTRYVAEDQTLYDENTGENPRAVSLGRKNIRFVFGNEPTDGLSVLPLARIVRDATGSYIYDPAYIPPILLASASERLMMILHRLIEILDEKSASLSITRRGASKFQAGFSSGEVAGFWFVHTINSTLTVLRHLYKSERGHPEQVFSEMARLAGALCTFGMESHPQQLPLYDHQNLTQCFRLLDEHIRTHLELVVPTNCIRIPLQSTGRYSYEGEITDQRCLDRARWVLALNSNVGETELIAKAPRHVKLSSSGLLPELVKTALPGLGLTHLPMPPSAIAPKIDFQYFGVSRNGPVWEHIVQTRKVGVHVPGEFPNPELELLIVLES